MFEIERKFRLQQGEYERILAELTERFGEPEKQHQTDTLFLNGHGFDTHVPGQPILRLRNQDGRHLFTYKRTVLETGNRIEHETPIENAEAMAAVIKELGWQTAVVIKKVRLEFRSDMFTYALDAVETVGQFIEIEYITTTDDPDAQAKLFAEAKVLGLDPTAQCEPKNYGRLVWEETQR